MKEKNEIKTSIGGQALIEGIMMRGPKMTALAVRRASGEILVDKWETDGEAKFTPINEKEAERFRLESEKREKEGKKQGGFMRFAKKCSKIPFVRGIFNMGLSLALGYKCLMRASDIYIADYPEPEEERIKREEKARKKGKDPDDTSLGFLGVVSMLLGILLAVGLFIVLPSYTAKWIMQLFGIDYNMSVVRSAIEGVLKVIIIILYMWLASLMKDIKRTFMYHGAEHMTIFCYEAGLDLTVENVKKQTRLHPRCGTSFIVLTVLVSIIIGIFIPGALPTWIRSIIKILLLPITMGCSYELIKLAGKHDNIITKIFSYPGLLLQKITTKMPEDQMIECAIAAMNEVIPDDGSDKI